MSPPRNVTVEKRKNKRLEITADAVIKRQGHTEISFSGKITNISDTGAYLETNAPIYKGDVLDLTIYFQCGANKLSMSLPCTVSRIDMNGVGVTSPHIDVNMLRRFELIFDTSKYNSEQLIKDFIEAI